MAAVSRRTKTLLGIVKIMIQIVWSILFYTLVVLVVLRLSMAAYGFSYRIFGNVAMEAAPGSDKAIVIEEGEGSMHIATKLENVGIIRDRYSFYVRTKLSTGSKKPIFPGSYKLNTSMSYGEIISVITNESTVGDPVK